MCDGFPMFYDHEPKEVIANYIYWLGEQGENIEGFTIADVPRADSAEISSPPRIKSKKKKKAAAPAKEVPPKKKKKSETKNLSEQNVALKTNPASKPSRRSTRYLPSDISSESDTSSNISGSSSFSPSPSPSPQPSPKPISFLPPQSESTPTPPASPLKRTRKLKIKTTHSETQKETTQNQPPKAIPTSDQVPPVHQGDSQPISQ